MTRGFLPAALIAIVYLGQIFTAQPATDLQELYRAHRWFELREALTPASSPLLRAAVANAFNDRQTAERLLLDIVKTRPRPEFANDAFDMLCQLYARTGQYARFLTTYREWSSRPATVTLQRNALIGGSCCLANVGLDVLKQAKSVSIDFAAMTVQLQ